MARQTEIGPEQHEQLKSEQIIWLTTVRKDGQPQPTPIWYLWDGETFIFYSQDRVQKLRNIRANPRVSVHLNTDERGDTLLRCDGTAEIVEGHGRAIDNHAFIEKYRDGLRRIGDTPQGFNDEYNRAIIVRPEVWYVW
jgi:PPOX class probable F420-dependent enzyme